MPSLKATFFRFILHWTQQPLMSTPEAFHQHIKKERQGVTPDPSESIRAILNIEETESGGSRVFIATPKDDGPIESRILYVHGGCFIFDLMPLHWDFIAILAKQLRARVTVPVYPLAPEHKLAEAYDMLQELYDAMAAEKSENPFWAMGDSAGGSFILGLTQRAVDAGKPTAARLVPISPCVDATFSNPDMFVTAIQKDPWLALPALAEVCKLTLGDLKREDHRISPIYGTIKGLPPMFMTLGTDDLHQPDAELFVQKARENGCDITSVTEKGLFHVWTLFPMPEAVKVQQQIFEWLRSERPAGN